MTDDPRIPGELPADPAALPRDRGPCDACGALDLLMPGNLCERCDELARATAAASAAARARQAPDLCPTSGERLSHPQLVLERGQADRAGGRVRCLKCGRQLVLVQGPFVRAMAPAHPAAGSDRR